MRNVNICAIMLLLCCAVRHGQAQYFQFSQYNFTPQRINPAQVSSSNEAMASFVYRNQATDGGFHLTSNAINASYPLMSRKGTRWAGVGVSFLDDRSGQAGIFSTQEAAVSFALSIPVAKYQSLSLGMKALYQSRKIDLDGLFTGSQYIPDRGFDESVGSGENLGQLRNNFTTFSAGLYWQQADRKGNVLGYAGLSFFDFNKPEDSFMGIASSLSTTAVASAGARVFKQGKVAIFPEALITFGNDGTVINMGTITRYELTEWGSDVPAHVDVITKYVVNRSAIVGLQLHRGNFSVGASYDIPAGASTVANTGAVEVGVALRKLVVAKKRPKRDSQARSTTPSQAGKKLGASVGVKKPVSKSPVTKTDSTQRKSPATAPTMSARLKQKQDSIRTQAKAGALNHTPLVLEKATLHFNFEFNSSTLDENATQYLDDLAQALRDNPELRLKLVGHTDNVGSEKFNQRLSVYRAESMKQHLLDRGIAPERVTVEGKGMSEPLNANSTDEERAKNRRVELTILYEE